MTKKEKTVLNPLDGLYMDAIAASYEFSMIYNLTKNTFTIRRYHHAFLSGEFPLSGKYDEFIDSVSMQLLKNDRRYQPSVRCRKEQLRRYRAGERYREDRYQIYDRKGKLHWVRERIVYIEDPVSGDVMGLSLAAVIDEEIQNERNNHRIHDELTGVFSRAYFYEQANRVLRQAEAEGCVTEYALIFNNIQNFKYYNIKYGRQSGDTLLQHVANSIETVGNDFLLARYGDDHFISITRDPDMIESITTGNRMFEQEFGAFGIKLKTGVYQITKEGMTAETAVDMAKIACDFAGNSQDAVWLYDEKLEKQLERNSYIEKNFDRALKNGYIKPYYQPVIRTNNGQLCGVEALARWIDPELGLLSPGDFIPVLEKNQEITRLDLYMLRQICKDIMTGVRLGGEFPAPVSFNLSKLDFLKGSVFDEVEEIVLESGVPRDLIRIEITESAVVTDPTYMKQVISKFQNAGYQIWMDDFGSGLSSLNLLTEYRFDEIKLDMLFLRSFDEQAKELIRSVIQMAKRLGIQTLAEGVETREQYAYLREIGCEKVQGYYFSKPLSFQGLFEYKERTGLTIEQRAMAPYYDKMGKIDYITDRSLAIVEFDAKKIRIIYKNSEFDKICRNIGNGEDFLTEYILNAPASTLRRKFLAHQNATYASIDFIHMDYSYNGKYFRIRSKCIARYRQYAVNQVEIQNITMDEQIRDGKELDHIFRMMYSMYDSIHVIGRDGSFFEVMKNNTTGNHLSENKESISRRKVAERYIFWMEHGEFMEFTDPATLKERLKRIERGYETRYFRSRTEQGGYAWKAHTIQYIPDNDMLLYSTRPAFFYQNGLIDRLVPSYMEEYKQGMSGLLCSNLFQSEIVSLFWKDKNRRFTGANRKFLETFGFQSEKGLIGKLDEEMGWLVDGIPFRNDEIDLLENGTVVRHRIGKCIIKGVLHTILVKKEPIFRDGEIVGLMGCLIDLNELTDAFGSIALNDVDPVTGLLSAQGMTGAIAEYMEGWNGRRENFAAIQLIFREYGRVYRTYGEDITRQMAGEIGKILVRICGDQSPIARLYAGRFTILKKYSDKDEILLLQKELSHAMQEVRALAGYSVTLNPAISAEYAANSWNENALIYLATGGSGSKVTLFDQPWTEQSTAEVGRATEKAVEISSEFELKDLWNTYEKLSETLYAADMDTYELLYMNKKGRETVGVTSVEDIRGRRCYEVIQGKSSPCEFCSNRQLMDGKHVEYDFFNKKYNMMVHVCDQRIVHQGRNIRIEHVMELNKEENIPKFDKADHVRNVINESIRMALEEQDADRGIDILLEYLGEVLRAERTYLFELTPDEKAWTNTYEWCAKGVMPEKDFLSYVPLEDAAVWKREFEKGNYVKIRDVEKIRESDRMVYDYLVPQNIHSLVVAPIFQGEKLYGFVGFDNPPKEMIDILSQKIRSVAHVLQSIMERRLLKEKLDEIIYVDSMTKLGNRHAVSRYFEEINRGQSIGIAFCDVCGLKYVNDNLGHLSGDALLLTISDLLREIFPVGEIFRWGGDEMMVLTSGVEKQKFYQYCETLKRRSLEQNSPVAVGGIWRERVDISYNDLLKEADKKMYFHKALLYQHYDVYRILMNNSQIVPKSSKKRQIICDNLQ
ncbi:MAG: EAL domain-containing protein [Eubacteriales bacterium]|nr:EAL domain-containing protein [Eubacteriales bacterium]